MNANYNNNRPPSNVRRSQERRARYAERLRTWAEGVRAVVDGKAAAPLEDGGPRTANSELPDSNPVPARLPYAD